VAPIYLPMPFMIPMNAKLVPNKTNAIIKSNITNSISTYRSFEDVTSCINYVLNIIIAPDIRILAKIDMNKVRNKNLIAFLGLFSPMLLPEHTIKAT
jgi:hypothetical protein